MFNDIKKPGSNKISAPGSLDLPPINDPTDLGPLPPRGVPETTVDFEITEQQPIAEPNKTRFWDFSWTFSKRTSIILGTIVAVLLAGALIAVWQTRPTGQGGVFISKKLPSTKPVETRVPSSLTGVLVDPAINDKPVIGVMIENGLKARPQSGLAEAGIVFEAIAEGGITRFLALYQDTEPDSVGPVRSARPYYVQWCGSFDCAYAHVGGSPEALAFIRSSGTRDMDQFANSGAYARVSTRSAPHNVYTSSAKLQQLAASKGFTGSPFTPFPRKKDLPSKTPNASAVSVRISSKNYNSTYAYDAATNSYIRSQNGAPHNSFDSRNNQIPIKPKSVVSLTMGYGIAADKHSQYATIGSGAGMVFQDGIATPITWTKAATKGPIVLKDANGTPIALNAGQTWIVAVANSSLVSHQ
jgi:hypothetical protein